MVNWSAIPATPLLSSTHTGISKVSPALIFASSTELENIKARLKSGRDKYVRDGGRLGKRKGSGIKTKEQMANEYKSVIKNLRAGQSIRNCAKITGVSPCTILKVKRMCLV